MNYEVFLLAGGTWVGSIGSVPLQVFFPSASGSTRKRTAHALHLWSSPALSISVPAKTLSCELQLSLDLFRQPFLSPPFKEMSELHLVSLNSLPAVSEVSGRTRLVDSILSGFIVLHRLMSNVLQNHPLQDFCPNFKKKAVSGERITGFLLLPSWPEVELLHVQL